MTERSKKQQAYHFGLRAEWLCLIYLRLRGYTLLAQRHRNIYGEIDLIMKRKETLIFIEVKARPTMQDGLYAIGPKQQMRIMRAALDFVGANRKYAGLAMRFDLMVVSTSRWPFAIHHLQHAFEQS